MLKIDQPELAGLHLAMADLELYIDTFSDQAMDSPVLLHERRCFCSGDGQENRLRYQLAQELTNRAILSQITNRSKGAKETEAYLSGVVQNQPNALALQLIPEDRELWHIENYELFLKTRRKKLADSLNTWLEGLAETHPVAEGISLEDMIAEGENEEVEFKQTLRWDIKQGNVNKELEGVIMKTIAAFANALGGTLLIGVADNGGISGLDNDYKALTGGNRASSNCTSRR